MRHLQNKATSDTARRCKPSLSSLALAALDHAAAIRARRCAFVSAPDLEGRR